MSKDKLDTFLESIEQPEEIEETAGIMAGINIAAVHLINQNLADDVKEIKQNNDIYEIWFQSIDNEEAEEKVEGPMTYSDAVAKAKVIAAKNKGVATQIRQHGDREKIVWETYTAI